MKKTRWCSFRPAARVRTISEDCESATTGYANSIVALHARTGEVVWHFQTVHHDLWDYDVASPALLYPGASGPAVAVGTKVGHLFLFDRRTGRPLFPIIERAVPASDVNGEKAADTQPFPSKPASLVPQQLTENDLWGATPEDLDACRRTLGTLRNEGVFTPPSLRGSLHVPGNIGGLHWGGVAWDAAQSTTHCAGQSLARHHSPASEGAVRRGEEGFPCARDHRAGWHALLHVS